jgi:hypothetical protein
VGAARRPVQAAPRTRSIISSLFLHPMVNLYCTTPHHSPLFCADTDNQRVIIKVKDINDEPPYFINRPLPMQVRTGSLFMTK